MKPLTKKQRAKIYLKAIERFDNISWECLCPVLCDSIRIKATMHNYDRILHIFPEFALFKPLILQQEDRLAWWYEAGKFDYNSGSRICCLLLCYEMCQ